jgi:hypothetical protein
MFALLVSNFKNNFSLTILKTVRLTESVLYIKYVLLFPADLIGTIFQIDRRLVHYIWKHMYAFM